MDKSLDELITLTRRKHARGPARMDDDGTGYVNIRRRQRRAAPYADREGRGFRDEADLRAVISAPKSDPRRTGFWLKLSNLHFNATTGDIATFLATYSSATRPISDPVIDYDNSGRSLGTASVLFGSEADLNEAKNAVHGLSLLDSIVTAEISISYDERRRKSADVARIAGGHDIVNEKGEYAYRSILDRMGANRPSMVSSDHGSRVLDRLGSRVLDRLGTKTVHTRFDGGRGARRNHGGRHAGARRRPVVAEDLDRQMDVYMATEGVGGDDLNEESAGQDDEGHGELEERGSRRRREFIDFDAPSVDPYTVVGGGSRKGRAVLDYGDLE